MLGFWFRGDFHVKGAQNTFDAFLFWLAEIITCWSSETSGHNSSKILKVESLVHTAGGNNRNYAYIFKKKINIGKYYQ